jgi:hypothetical protein
MHSDCGGCEGVVWREYQGAPVLPIVVGRVWRAGKDIMPSVRRLAGEREAGKGGKTYSKMLDSEGWAMMYGGGFSEIVLYSRVNCSLSISSLLF